MTTKNAWTSPTSGSLRVLILSALVCAASTFVPARFASAADPITDANVAERVASAQTAADHEALATYFDAQAAAAAAKVKMHEGMLTDSARKAAGKSWSSWEMHCKSLIRTYKAAQKDAEGLAEAQRKMAKKAAK